MLYSSLAILALAMPSLGTFLHLHPASQSDGRVAVTIVNHSQSFRDIRIDGHTYELGRDHQMVVKASPGTIVYRDSSTQFHKRGEVLLALTPQANGSTISID